MNRNKVNIKCIADMVTFSIKMTHFYLEEDKTMNFKLQAKLNTVTAFIINSLLHCNLS